MANIVLTVLSITVGLFFILSGTLKLNPIISDEIYKEMVRNFKKLGIRLIISLCSYTVVFAFAPIFMFVLLQRKIFIRTAKVVPFVKLLGLKLDPHLYRRVIGVTEVVCGLLLAVVPGTICILTF